MISIKYKISHSLALLSLVCAAAPKVLVAHSIASNMLLKSYFTLNTFYANGFYLELPLLVRAVDAGQVHPVEPAVLLRLVPVGLSR